jgi:hypothetical protein
MASTNLESIAQTLHRLATPDMKPKDLMRSVREAHPDVSKKDVVRAAFFSVIAHAGEDAARADRLHDFALRERADLTEVPEPKVGKKRKSKRAKS